MTSPEVATQTDLVGEFVFDVLLDTPEHEGLEYHVESAELVGVDGGLALDVVLDVLGEPLAELLVGVEQRRHDEVQQRPELPGVGD